LKRRLDFATVLMLMFSVTMSVGSQVMLRRGMSVLDGLGAIDLARGAATSPWVVGGLAFYLLGTVVWLLVLSRLDLAVAYPLGALNYVFITALSATVLHETIPPLRWVGTAIILIGILVVARGETTQAPPQNSQAPSESAS